MEATLTWLDLTASDRDKMRRVLDLFNEQGTLDEMGLGSLRDAISDALFPGTSYLQTRLRYVLFVPWIYRRLESRLRDRGNIAEVARQIEIGLIGALELGSDTDGIIGVRARASLVRLPSSVYWNALTTWGIFQHEQSQGWYHSNFATLAGAESVARADDPGVVWSRYPNWHPRLPDPPSSFPGDTSFALTGEDAEFLRGRMEERCSGTLLAWMARNGSDTPTGSLWDDPDALRAPNHIRCTVELARRFSLHVEGMPLLYNLLVAERRIETLGTDDTDEIDRFRAELAEWTVREANEDSYEPDVLWQLLARQGVRLRSPQRLFVERWGQRIAELAPGAVADDGALRSLIRSRELQLKSARARLANVNRLLDWQPGVGVGRMDFRWVRVRRLLTDLHRGIVSDAVA